MRNFKKKVLNYKFLSTLSLVGLSLLFTSKTSNAMFKNPRVNMPLIKSGDGKPLFLPKTYTGNNNPVTYIMESRGNVGGNSSNLKNKIPTPPSSPTNRTIPNPLVDLGDDLHNQTLSENIGNSLRRYGNRFN